VSRWCGHDPRLKPTSEYQLLELIDMYGSLIHKTKMFAVRVSRWCGHDPRLKPASEYQLLELIDMYGSLIHKTKMFALLNIATFLFALACLFIYTR
jgi:hypothetical protein